MIRRIAAFIVAVALASQSARAEAFDRTGYKLPIAVEFLVAPKSSKINLTIPSEQEVLLMYMYGFGSSLAGEWPNMLSKEFGSRAFHKMTMTMVASGDKMFQNAGFAGVEDAKLFAKRVGPNTNTARSVVALLISVLGK